MKSCLRPAGLVSALAAASLAAGCINLEPPYERPAAPVAPQFPLAASAAQAGTPAADVPWSDFFRDERLRSLVSTALQNNRDLRVSVLNIEAARAQLGLRRADEWPTVNAAATGTRQPGPTGGISSVYTVGLAVAGYELDLFGRVRSLSDAALAQLAATEEARKAAQISLVASVAGLYYALAGDNEQIRLTERTLATRQESLRLTKLRFDAGVIAEQDWRAAQTLVESARASLIQLQRQRLQDRNALEQLLGQPLAADVSPTQAWNTLSLPDVPAGLPSEVLLRRPDVRQAEQQLISANANIGAARAAFLPRISLTGSYGTASTSLNGLFKNTAWTFSPAVSLPIFDAGRNRFALQASESARDIAVAQYEKAIQAAFRDVADALAGRATLDDQLKAQQAVLDAETVRYRLATLRFQQGVASSLEQLDAERSLFAAQQAVAQTQVALLQNRIAVYRALGGGWTGP